MPQPFFEGGVLGATIRHILYKAKMFGLFCFLFKKIEHDMFKEKGHEHFLTFFV
jgi:hypothetical protein